MRKILLASTALVAMTSVSAMASDITISGGFELGYNLEQDQADGTAITSETDWNVKFSNTTDSGITTSLNYGFDESGGVDDQNYSISGSFGTIAVANSSDGDDSAVDALDIEADTVAENSTFVSHTATLGPKYDGSWGTRVGSSAAGVNASGDSLSYTLPSVVDGLTIAVSHQNETSVESTAYGAKYSMGPVTVAAAKMKGFVDAKAATTVADGKAGNAAQSDVDMEGSHMGVSIKVAGLVAEYAINKYEMDAAGTESEGEGKRMGLSYAIGDITLGYEVVDAKWDGTTTTTTQYDTYGYSSVGAAYSVAEGITAKIAVTEAEIQDSADETKMKDYNTTRVSVSVAF
jgi:hypothetical protein